MFATQGGIPRTFYFIRGGGYKPWEDTICAEVAYSSRLTVYYGRFIRGCGIVSRALTDLFKKDNFK